MLMRTEWREPPEEPERRWRAPPGRALRTLFWACIIFCVLTQLLLFY